MKPLSKNQWLSILVLPIWLGLMLLPLKTVASLEEQVQYYINEFGRANAENELVHRVHNIFEKVSLVADKIHAHRPQLVVINGFGSPSAPLAVALPDGHIVLSLKALEIMYNKVSPEQGDTRAAFVLGHELAHLAKNDFLHHLSATNKRQVPCNGENCRVPSQKDNEKRADDRGFIYAAMAGYPVDKLLAEGHHQQNFFVYWEQQTFRGDSETHPRPQKRAQMLWTRLKQLLDMLPYFQFGVRLSHFNRCEEAVYLLEYFSRVFPAREVLNNLGLCYLQQARQELGKAAYTYWLPSVLDVTTQIDGFSLPTIPKGEEMSPVAKRFLTNAKGYFNLALKKEPSYWAASVNLAITAFYLGAHQDAQVAIEHAYRLAPNDLEIQGLRALFKHQDKPLKAIQALEKLAQHPKDVFSRSNAPALERIQPNVLLSVFYNLAQLLEQHGRTRAADIWQQLARQAAKLPEPIRLLVCEKTACAAQQTLSPKATWTLPVKLGVKTMRHKTLASWQQSSEMRLPEIYEQFYWHGSTEVLGLRRRVAMVVLKKFPTREHGNERSLTTEDLSAYCGQPLRQRTVVNGIILSCRDWAALVVDDKVKEVWIIKP